jgi:hypothetical protein
MEAVAVRKLEVQFASLLGLYRDDSDFFPRLANRRLQRSFTRFDFSAGSIHFPSSETATFADQQETSVLADKAKSCVFTRSPVSPVHLQKHDGRRRKASENVGARAIPNRSSGYHFACFGCRRFLAVALGALAHGLRTLRATTQSHWETATLYHLVHAVVLLVIATRGRWRAGPWRCFAVGS